MTRPRRVVYVVGTVLVANVRARGPVRTPALEGDLRLRDVSISGKGIASPVRTPAIDVSLAPDVIRSNDFSVTTAGTTVGVHVALSRYATPKPLVDARVRTANAEVGEILNAARAWGVGSEGTTGTGRMNLNVRASGPLDAMTLTGSGTLENATIQLPSIAEPVRIARASLSFNRDTAVLDHLTAGIGSTNATGRLTVRTFTAPDVDFELTADRIDARELQRLLSPRREPRDDPTPGRQTSGQSVLARTTGGGRLRVGSIAFDKLVFDEVQATVRLDRGLLRMDPLTAGLFGGRHHGSVVLDAGRMPAVFTVSSSLEKVDANQLISAVTSLKNIVNGAANATVRMTFAGDRAEDLPRSMNGTLSFNLGEGRIANLNLRQEIANMARVVIGAPKTERSTRVAALTGDFDVKNGLARTNNLKFSIEGATLAAAGTIDLADQRVDLRLVSVLSKEFTRRAGASRVGELLTTALVDERGEFIVPIIIGGTMSAPRVWPDTQRVSELKRKGAVTPPEKGTAEKGPAEKGAVDKAQDALREMFRRRQPGPTPADPPPQSPPK